MIGAADFRMVEVIAEADLRAHPLWADFRESTDRERILGWGVAPERLAAEIVRYDYCGRPPLFPVLELADAARLANPTVALRIEPREGEARVGYRVGRDAIGVFAGGVEACLNPQLPRLARRELERLAAALGTTVERLLPLRHARADDLRGVDTRELERAFGPLEGSLDLA